MYNLYELSDNLYQIHSGYTGEKAMEGTLLAILTYATYVLGFNPNELERALLDMLDKNCDASHFGINRTFIYSFRRGEKRAG
jgi:hypothetical protein